MSQAGLLFITAPNADQKAINRVLLHLRNWEYGSEGNWDSFYIVTTKEVDAFKASITDNEVEATVPPHAEDAAKEWQNSSLSEVESFMLNLSKTYDELPNTRVNTHTFLLIDSKGLEEKTCIVAEHKYDDEAETRIDAFDKVRVPWEEAQTMWANLDIGNMDFDDYCADEEGCDENHWWRWDDSEYGAALGLSEELQAERRESIQKLVEEGKA